ncbi:MAG: hypothetical protein PVJ84_04910 [Desulfobacteraceae bacterium]|jgi:hypothetical protein
MTVFVSASADSRHVLSHGYAVPLVRANPLSALNSPHLLVITECYHILKEGTSFFHELFANLLNQMADNGIQNYISI